ncbi:MAG: M20/M25/M40 family metallo-hydrolase, partial [Bacteroidota bacterium]|nr:M20/M25/M40 family metallo-hydrolase [Bacteroidota bacterium]
KGKIIVRLAGFPGQHDTTSVAWQNFKKLDKSTLIEKKNELAQKLGAVAILEFDPSVLSKKLAANVPFRFNEAMYEGDSRPESFYDRRMVLPGIKKNQIPLISVSEKVFNEFLSPSGLSYAKFEGTAAQLKQNSFDLKKINAGFNLTANTRALQLRNVLGIIEGEKTDEFIVVGGHYDHLGKHNGFIWNGADDNGSGAIAVTSIAKAFNETGMKPKRSIIFACWDGEERGELGSSYFVDHFNKIEQVKAYLNFDMIGRNSGPDAPNNQVALLYSKSAEYLADLTREQLKQANINLNINYSPMENPAGGSDNTAFALKNVPMFWYHTGGHTDYHQASDHAELINWAKMTDIIKLSFLSVWKLSNE